MRAALTWLEARVARLEPTRSRRVHNLAAHPLLELWPAAGEWLHARTDPMGGIDGDARAILPIIIRGPMPPAPEDLAQALESAGPAGVLYLPDALAPPADAEDPFLEELLGHLARPLGVDRSSIAPVPFEPWLPEDRP